MSLDANSKYFMLAASLRDIEQAAKTARESLETGGNYAHVPAAALMSAISRKMGDAIEELVKLKVR